MPFYGYFALFEKLLVHGTKHLVVILALPINQKAAAYISIFADQDSKMLFLKTIFFFGITGIMGEYEPKIEVQFPETVPAAKGSSVRLECFALGK